LADKHYVNEVGTAIIVDCGCDITGATLTKLKVLKPDEVTVEWPASIEGSNFLKYVVKEGDFPLPGLFRIQASLTLAGWSGLGETALVVIYKQFN